MSDLNNTSHATGSLDLDINGDRLREECGVFGIFGHPDAAAITALGLHALQHRGQEAAGIVTFDGRRFQSERRQGLVGDHFSDSATIERLPGKAAPNPILLLDDAGQTLATAEPVFGGMEVSHDGQSYVYRKTGILKTEWFLYRAEDVNQPVGSLAKEKFFGGTVRLQLPAGMNEAFQVFLFWLRLNAEMQAAANSGGD